MSRFIQIVDQHSFEQPQILKGQFTQTIFQTKISPKKKLTQKTLKFRATHKPNKSLYPLSTSLQNKESKDFFKYQTNKRFIQQIKYSDDLQKNMVTQEYKKMKKKLKYYGWSDNNKLLQFFESKVNDQSKDEQSYIKQNQIRKKTNSFLKKQQLTSKVRLSKQIKPNNKQKLFYQYDSNYDLQQCAKIQNSLMKNYMQIQQKQRKRCLSSMGRTFKNTDNVVYLDRKYNNQFSIKLASIIQAEKIKSIKDDYHNQYDNKSYYLNKPLINNSIKHFIHSNPIKCHSTHLLTKNQYKVQLNKDKSKNEQYSLQDFHLIQNVPIQPLGFIKKQTNKDYKSYKRVYEHYNKKTQKQNKQQWHELKATLNNEYIQSIERKTYKKLTKNVKSLRKKYKQNINSTKY